MHLSYSFSFSILPARATAEGITSTFKLTIEVTAGELVHGADLSLDQFLAEQSESFFLFCITAFAFMREMVRKIDRCVCVCVCVSVFVFVCVCVCSTIS